ncbi:chitin deacetylase [Sodiomyces alkalinus F11]|uniref:Chitin deacetylase n=1 Tax=Sodiomyces alkalinus (strain CBS 110278 / VKM F-3762 / F11) TaxID=1314773 RepID=A0A3N2Q5J9_SODAK|nr:chitin deacetylase [Sodiomyces alkalinus F11]ROT42054.1 chitin deacetylase [Sodiomyces alkalinus F11]
MRPSSFSRLAAATAVVAVAVADSLHQRNVDSSSSVEGLNCNAPRNAPPLGQVITTCRSPGQVALTYDDGPYIHTSSLLDHLDDLNVTATFFLVGSNWGRQMDEDEWASIVRRMHAAGHQLASHTWDHEDLNLLDRAGRAQQMRRNGDVFRNILGFAPRYMRPPFLSCGESCVADLSDMGYYVVDTDLDTNDWQHNTPETVHISERIFDDLLGWEPRGVSRIVLAHDTQSTTVHRLTSHMISTLRGRGFEAVTVGECLGDPKNNWYWY